MGGHRIIIVTGYEVLVDERDYEFVSSLGLSIVHRHETLKHVCINTKPYYKKYLHRVLLLLDDPRKIVDHINQNGLDNRRDNLRITNKVGNALNMKVNKNKKSGLPKGVYKERDGYKACIQYNGLNRYLGHFLTVEKALARYTEEVEKYWRELHK